MEGLSQGLKLEELLLARGPVQRERALSESSIYVQSGILRTQVRREGGRRNVRVEMIRGGIFSLLHGGIWKLNGRR